MRTRITSARLTEGAEALKRALHNRGWNRADLARALGCDSGLVSRWCNGGRIPERDYAMVLLRVMGVPIELWSKPARKPSTPPTKAA